MKLKLSITALLLVVPMYAMSTYAADTAAADGATLFRTKTCFSCHGKDGKKSLLPDYPKIAGQNRKYAERQMLDIKSGKRANGNSAAMKGIMGLVSEAEISILAEYVSQLEP